MRKYSRILLSIMLIVAMLVTGCSKSSGKKNKDKSNDTTTVTTVAKETTEATTSESSENADATAETAVTSEAEETTESTEATTTESEETAVVSDPTIATTEETEAVPSIDKDGSYTSKDDVALYIYTYGELPSNFITKKEAKQLGWEGGSLEPYAPGMSIGGDYFGNYEGVLPDGTYHECDIDTLGKSSRGAKRIVFSDDGRIYYTEDHYETFVLLYGEE